MTTISIGTMVNMAIAVFVDTGAHYALADAADPDHAEAVQLLRRIERLRYGLVTSNFVIAETYTLILKRLGWEAAIRYIEALRAGSSQILSVSGDDETQAWHILRRYRDQDFSYVDATSFAMMERLNIHIFFAFDSHFSIYRTRRGAAFTSLQFVE